MCTRSYRVIFINVVLCGLFLYGYIAFRNYSYFSGLGVGMLMLWEIGFQQFKERATQNEEQMLLLHFCFVWRNILFYYCNNQGNFSWAGIWVLKKNGIKEDTGILGAPQHLIVITYKPGGASVSRHHKSFCWNSGQRTRMWLTRITPNSRTLKKERKENSWHFRHVWQEPGASQPSQWSCFSPCDWNSHRMGLFSMSMMLWVQLLKITESKARRDSCLQSQYLGVLRPEGSHEFEGSLGYRVIFCSKRCKSKQTRPTVKLAVGSLFLRFCSCGVGLVLPCPDNRRR